MRGRKFCNPNPRRPTLTSACAALNSRPVTQLSLGIDSTHVYDYSVSFICEIISFGTILMCTLVYFKDCAHSTSICTT